MTSTEAFRGEALRQAFSSYPTDNGLSNYISILGITPAEITSSRILDVGSGFTNQFARDIQSLTGNERVIGVNPHLAFPALTRAGHLPTEYHQQSSVAACSPNLPFRRESFGLIVALLSVPKELEVTQVPDALNDMWDLLEPGGALRMWPWYCEPDGKHTVGLSPLVQFEPLAPAVVTPMAKPFQRFTKRLVIRKPPANIPDKIAQLQELQPD